MATKKKKVSKKAVKKTVKKITKKVMKKSVKKVTKKSSPKVVKKTTKKPVKKVAKKAKLKPQVKIAAKVTPKSVPKLTPKVNIDYAKAITPLGDRLVVRVATSEKVTPGGLIIPDSASMATGYLKATVLAVGFGGKSKKGLLRPLDVKVGDTVLFAEHSGTKVSFNSEELQIIHESDVMGIVQN